MPSSPSTESEVDPQLALLLQRRLQLKKRKLKAFQESGISFYEPHDKQDQFHRAGEFKGRMIRAGNRFGKSEVGTAEDIGWMLGERVWYPKDDPARYAGIPKHPVKGLVIVENWKKVGEIFTGEDGKFTKLLPKSIIKKSRHGGPKGEIDYILLANGSSATFVTVQGFKNSPLSMESSDWDFIHVDEPCPEDMFKAAARGLVDRNGKYWFVLTPLTEMWINDKFFPHPSLKKGRAENLWAIEGTMWDNPYNTKEAIDAFLAELTDDERICRELGKPLALSGLVYKQYSYDRHVLRKVPYGWKDWHLPPFSYTISFSLDSHTMQTPNTCLFLAVAPTGQVFLYDEIYDHLDPEDMATEIKRRLAGHISHWRVADPFGWIPDPTTGNMYAEELGKHGVFVTKASKNKALGIQKVRQAFIRPDYFYVSPHLERFHYEINRYVYDRENKPIDKDDHTMECLYRLFINDPIWIRPSPQNLDIDRKPISLDLS